MFGRIATALVVTALIAIPLSSADAQSGNADQTSNCLNMFLGAPSPASDPNATKETFSCNILNTAAANADLFSFDYGIPHSPALMLAGLSTDKITPASSLKPFVLSLPGLLGSGSTATSAALDTAPAWVFGDQQGLSSFNYAEDGRFWDRLWYRTRISVAVAKGDDGGGDPAKIKPSRAAIGVSVSLLDNSDPIMARTAADGSDSHWVHCLRANASKLYPYTPPEDSGFQTIASSVLLLADVQRDSNYWHKDPSTAAADAQSIDELKSAEAVADTVLGRTSKFAYSAHWDDPQFRKDQLTSDIKALNLKRAAIMTSDVAKATDTAAVPVITACAKEASDVAQHGADLQIGAGVVWRGDPSGQGWHNFRDPNFAVWVAGRIPLDFNQSGSCESSATTPRSELSCWTVGGSGRFSAGEYDATGNTATPEFKADVLEGWAGIERVDSKSKIGAYYGYTDQRAADDADKAFSKSGSRWLFSGAYSLDSLYSGLWIVGSYGAANGTVSTLDDKVALLTLTFGPPKIGSGFVASDTPASPAQGSTGGAQ
jgi:hypothetical protein